MLFKIMSAFVGCAARHNSRIRFEDVTVRHWKIGELPDVR